MKSKMASCLTKLSSLHVLYHMVIQDLKDVMHHLKKCAMAPSSVTDWPLLHSLSRVCYRHRRRYSLR